MSYDISMYGPDEYAAMLACRESNSGGVWCDAYGCSACAADHPPLTVDAFEDGGTYCVGGTDEASLNITYNYGGIFRRVLGDGGIRSLYSKTGAEMAPKLREAVAALGEDRDDDYWRATDGNAGAALARLLKWADQHPDGVFDGD